MDSRLTHDDLSERLSRIPRADIALREAVVPDNSQSSIQSTFWTICIILPASDNPFFA